MSVPDDLFEQAEQAARRLDLNRSQLYARALAADLPALEAGSLDEGLRLVLGLGSA